MFLFFVIALLSLSYLWLRNRYSYWERRGVPGPKPVFVFGNLLKQLTFQEHMSTAHQKWHNTYNNVPYVGFYKLLTPAVMIRDPELQREVLVKAFSNFHTNDVTMSDGDELIKSNPFFTTGEEWRNSRTIFGSFFSANKTRSVFPAMLEVGKEWEQYVRSLGPSAEVEGKEVSFKVVLFKEKQFNECPSRPERKLISLCEIIQIVYKYRQICSRFTTETMLRCTFSINGKSFEKESEFLDIGKSLFNPDLITTSKIMISFFVPILHKFFTIS